MRKKFFVFYILLSLIICGCAYNNISSENKLNTSIDEFTSSVDSCKSETTQKYICAKRIYDFQYDVDGYKEDVLTIEELPGLTFIKNDNVTSFSIEGRSDLGSPRSIYLADFNNDGHIDLGYSQSRGNGSSTSNFYLVRIYDYHNDKLIFDDDNNRNSMLDLDEEGNVIIEELATSGSSLRELIRAGKFLKGTEISFEWYTFDFKLKSIFLEFSKYEDGRGIAYLNQKTNVMLRLYGIGSESLDKAIPIEQINVKRNDELYSFEVTNSSIASIFNITYTFLQTGTIEIYVSIDQVTASEQINIVLL